MELLQRFLAPLHWIRAYRAESLKGDLLGGFVSALVLFPLSLSYGALSGLGVMSGLYSAIALSLFGSLFGGVKSLIRGPNIILVLLMTAFIAEYAKSLAGALTLVMMAGVIQMVFGLLKLGRFVAYTPYPLLAGLFTAMGIGLLAFQVPVILVGNDLFHSLEVAPAQTQNLASLVQTLPNAIARTNLHALATAGLAFALALVWRERLARFLPAPVIMLAVGWLAATLWFTDAPTIGQGVVGSAPGFPRPILPILLPDVLLRNLRPALVLALLSSVSTLILAFRADTLTGDQHDPNQELVGLGIGNTVAGLFGGIPGGIHVGSLTNIHYGGRTPVSGIFAALLLLAVVAIPGSVTLIETIPFAALGAVTIATGLLAIDWKFLRRIRQIARADVVLFLAVIALAFFLNFLTAIVLGFILAGLLGVRRAERDELGELISVPLLDQVVLGDAAPAADPFAAQSGLVVFPRHISLASARELSRIVTADVQTHRIVVFDLSRTTHLDITAATVIGQLVDTVTARQTKAFVIAGLAAEVEATLNALELLDNVPAENFVKDMAEAHRIVGHMLRENAAAG